MNKKVLFVDDENFALELIRRKIVRSSIQALYADSAEKALKLLDLDPDIGIIVSDLNMEGMNGFELLRRVKGQYPDVIRIVLTAHYGRYYAKRALEDEGVDFFLNKPINCSYKLIPILEALIEEGIEGAEVWDEDAIF